MDEKSKDELIAELEAKTKELTTKIEALEAEYSANKDKLEQIDAKNKELAVENQRLLLRQPAEEITDAVLFAPFMKRR